MTTKPFPAEFADHVRSLFRQFAGAAGPTLKLAQQIEEAAIAQANIARAAAGEAQLTDDDSVVVAALSNAPASGREFARAARFCIALRESYTNTRVVDALIIGNLIAQLHKLHPDHVLGAQRRAQIAAFAGRPRDAGGAHNDWRAWARAVMAEEQHANANATKLAKLIKNRHGISASVQTIRKQLGKKKLAR